MDFSDGLKFFDSLLRDDYPWSLSDEYPLVFDKTSSVCHVLDSQADQTSYPDLGSAKSFQLILTENAEPVAGLACLLRSVEMSEDLQKKLLFVGSVVTHPEHRNKGLQRKLFHHLVNIGLKESWDALLLWSNQIDFYQKLGFELGGLQASWIPSVSKKGLENSSPPFPLACESEFREVWYKVANERRLVPKRSLKEMRSLFKIPQMFLVEEGDAYALIGKGADFEGVCHEWAGPAEQVLKCFERIKEVWPEARFLSPGVVHSHDEMTVMKKLETAGYEMRLEYLGIFRPLSPQILLSDLQPNQLKYPFFVWGLDSI